MRPPTAQGNFGGFDIDVAHAIAAELGVQARFDNLSYDTLYDALAVRRVDVLISMIVAEKERTMDVSYSPAYYDAGQVLVVAEGSPHHRHAGTWRGGGWPWRRAPSPRRRPGGWPARSRA